MKNRRYSRALLLSFSFALGLATVGCGSGKEPPAENGKFDPKNMPPGAYDMDKMKEQMKKGGGR